MQESAAIVAICAIALTAFGVVGCSSNPHGASLTVSCDEFSATPNMTKGIEVPVGSPITVTLCSNPTTGFQWGDAQIVDPTVVSQTNRNFAEPGQSGGQPVMGAPGQDVWTFKALKKGSTTISMSYDRPWEAGEKGVWTFKLTVTVK